MSSFLKCCYKAGRGILTRITSLFCCRKADMAEVKAKEITTLNQLVSLPLPICNIIINYKFDDKDAKGAPKNNIVDTYIQYMNSQYLKVYSR